MPMCHCTYKRVRVPSSYSAAQEYPSVDISPPQERREIVSKKEKILTWLSPPRLPMQAHSGRLSDGHNDKFGEAQGSWGR